MNPLRISLLAALLWAWADVSWSQRAEQTNPEPRTESVSLFVQKLRDEVGEEDCLLALAGLAPLAEETEFHDIQRAGRQMVLKKIMYCAKAAERQELELRHLPALVELEEKTDERDKLLLHWFRLGVYEQKPSASQAALAVMARHDPNLISKIKQNKLWRHFHSLKEVEDPQTAQFRMLGWLVENNYTAPDKSKAPGAFHAFYADGLMRRDKIRQAEEVLLAHPDPVSFAKVHVLKAYAPLRKRRGFAKKFNIEKSRRTQQQKAEERQLAHPDSLGAVFALLRIYRQNGMWELASKLAQKTSGMLDKAKLAQEPAFVDLNDKQNWFLNEWAWLANDAGDADRAIELMKLASETAQQGTPNVSQQINLGILLMEREKPEAALIAMQRMADRNTSPFGQAFVHMVMACSHQQLGNHALMQTQISKLSSLQKQNPSAYRVALLCAGYEEEAAAGYMSALRDPLQANKTLMALQIYKTPPHESPWQLQMRKKLQIVLSRPDVKAELAKIGKISELPFYDTYMSDL